MTEQFVRLGAFCNSHTDLIRKDQTLRPLLTVHESAPHVIVVLLVPFHFFRTFLDTLFVLGMWMLQFLAIPWMFPSAPVVEVGVTGMQMTEEPPPLKKNSCNFARELLAGMKFKKHNFICRLPFDSAKFHGQIVQSASGR